MIDVGREIDSAVRIEWSELREEVVWAGVRPRQRRRVVARVALACVVVAAVGGTVKLRSDGHGAVQAPAIPAAAATEPVQAPAGKAPIAEAAPSAPPITVVLARGARRFEVREQRYMIRSGRITIDAQNAVFACARSEHATRVEVFRGTVLVHDVDGEREVRAGESVDFHEPAAAQQSADPVEDLLRTADVMRLSHQPGEAVSPLRRVIKAHPRDRRAPLAAFTLGRLLLDELDRPREAAAAFANAIRLAPEGALVEDALARQIEALSRAGDSDAAKQLAVEYLDAFPHGRKVNAVRAFGGLP